MDLALASSIQSTATKLSLYRDVHPRRDVHPQNGALFLCDAPFHSHVPAPHDALYEDDVPHAHGVLDVCEFLFLNFQCS